MERHKVTWNLVNWGDFLRIGGIIGIIIGVIILSVETTAGIALIGVGVVDLLVGIILRGLSVIVQAANKYLDRDDPVQ